MSGIGIRTLGVLGCAFALCGMLSADGLGDWNELKQLSPGNKVKVELRGKRSVDAVFQTFTPDGLRLLRGHTSVEFSRVGIRRIYRVQGRTRLQTAAPWIGAAVGFGAGFAVGWKAGDPPTCSFLCFAPRSKLGPAAGGVGAVLGAAVGYLLPRQHKILIYDAR